MATPDVDELLKRLKIASKDTDPFEAIIKDAKEYDDAIKHGDKEKLKKFDFSVSPVVSCLGPYALTVERLANHRVFRVICGGHVTQCMRCSKPCMDLVNMTWKVCRTFSS